MADHPPLYFAYMLRVWQASNGGSLVWRASLEAAHSGPRIGFADLESLFAFLRQQTAQYNAVAGLSDTELTSGGDARDATPGHDIPGHVHHE
jgi:hypothetical protein